MLKTVSSITNALGALNYKGTWNASTNSPALASGAGTKGDYYVVSVAGTTALDGISNWGVGDWATFNGSVWQRVEGGADLNGVNLSVSGTSTLANVQITGNTVSTTNTNGNLTLDPNGSGFTIVAAPTNGTIAQLGDTNSRTFYFKQNANGGFANDTLSVESDSGVGRFEFKNTTLTQLMLGSNGVNRMPAYGAGAATFDSLGTISSVSDETWKVKDGVPANPIEMLKGLQPGYWYYTKEKQEESYTKERQLGFYAQNVNACIGPEAAPTPVEGKPWGYYDRSVLAVVTMALQNALERIESLESEISKLKGV
jgi:hypothetical protein